MTAGPKRIPTLIFGVGSLHRRLLRSQRLRLLRRAFDIGFRAFDVAPAYGNGLNEQELGLALGSDRSQCRVTTKFGIPADLYGARHPHLFHLIRGIRRLRPASYGDEYRRRVFSAAEMQRSLDGSLRQLGRDYVDDFMIHEPLGVLASGLVEELHDKADRLKRQGKILRWGVAGRAASVAQFVHDPRIDVLQFPLQDVGQVTPLGSHHTIGYGLHRAYLASAHPSKLSYPAYVRRCLDQGAMDLIVGTTTPAKLEAFSELFQHG